DEDTAKVNRVHEQSRNGVVADVAPAPWPRGSGGEGDQEEQSGDEAVAQGQKGQRPGMGQAKPGPDKAGAPKHHEESRNTDLLKMLVRRAPRRARGCCSCHRRSWLPGGLLA